MNKKISHRQSSLLCERVSLEFRTNVKPKDHLIKGEWKNGEKRKIKISEITERGKEVFRKAIQKHFSKISVTRTLILKESEP